MTDTHRPPRIVHLDFGREWRGGQQQLLLLARALRARGIDQALVAPPGPVADRLRSEGLSVTAPGWTAARMVRRATVAHAHDGRAHSWLLAVAAAGAAGRLLTRRVAYPIRRWSSRWAYRRLDLVVAVSEQVRREVLTTGCDPARVRVLPDAVDLAALPDQAAARRRVRAQIGLSERRHWLVCLGAFTPEKGLDDLLRALARLPDEYAALLPGEGPERGHLEAQARALGDRVRFVSSAGLSAAEWVSAGDALVMPSRSEGLGSAALLGMALRRPVVATAAGGIPELVEHDRSGLLSVPGDAAALARSCRRVCEDAGLRRRLIAAGAQRVRRYDIETLAPAMLDLYLEVQSPRRRLA